MDNKISQMWPQKINRKCSFCGTTEKDAKHFIASIVTSHCICDKCIKQGKKLVDETNIVEK